MVNFKFKFTVLYSALSGKQESYTKGTLALCVASKGWGFEILRMKVHCHTTESYYSFQTMELSTQTIRKGIRERMTSCTPDKKLQNFH